MNKTNNLAKTISSAFPFAFILIAPFLNFLRFNDYGYQKPEVWVISLGLITVGLVCAGLYAYSNWAIRAVLVAVAVTVALSFFPGWQTLIALLTTGFILLTLSMIFSKDARELLTIFSLVFLLAILFFPINKQLSDAKEWRLGDQKLNSKLPPIVYLILDEHAGVDAIPQDTERGRTLRNNLINFYLHAGFSLFGHAYSHYPSTYNSIPNLLNFTQKNKDDFYFTDPEHRVLKQNTFFKILAQQGYQIKVYQPDFMDYCKPDSGGVSSCYTYSSLSIKNITKFPLVFSERLEFLWKSFLLQSSCYQAVMHLYQFYLRPFLLSEGWSVPEWKWYQARVSSLTMIDVFAKLRQDILQQPKGTVFFAHLLAPHNPFVFDANCKLIPMNDWQIGRGPLPFVNSVETRKARYALYENQVACVQKQMQLLVRDLQSTGTYQNATIIVHGDHGSRIGLHRPLPTKSLLTQQDFQDYYFALFAMKLPGKSASYDQHLVDLQTLLASAAHSISGQSITYTANAPFVYLYPRYVGDDLSRMTLSNFTFGRK